MALFIVGVQHCRHYTPSAWWGLIGTHICGTTGSILLIHVHVYILGLGAQD